MKTLDEKRDLLKTQIEAVMTTLREVAELAGIQMEDASVRRVSVIQRVVREHFRLPATVMSSPIKKMEYVECRHIAMFLCRELTNGTLESIAKAFRKSMDHGTVNHACYRVTEGMKRREYSDQISTIRAKCIDALDASESPLFEYAKSKAKSNP